MSASSTATRLLQIAVGDVGLVGLRVDADLGDAAEVLGSLLPAFVAELADLQQELAVLGELQDVRVLLAVAADPDVALVVDVDAVVRLRPLVALARAAPGATRLPAGSNTSTGGAARAALADRR